MVRRLDLETDQLKKDRLVQREMVKKAGSGNRSAEGGSIDPTGNGCKSGNRYQLKEDRVGSIGNA